ncbi:hypothetical protein L3Y34_002352 [Caenorhabditis briggsae]|uniref:Uncharacterized protein n=1 Tax=Caenorhabditis briggsae TaxID=6238 RepID=A0AAE9IRY7_CAEBR|nr:hypothetical protein L3Y34_002352 [Caenorhabditis briggsae]
MWTNLAPEEGNFYVNVAKALTMEYEKACSEFNPQNALPASMNLQEQVFGFGSTFRNQHVAASVPEAPRFTDLSDVQPAGLNHLQMNVFQNWTPECPFQFNPYGQYLNQDHSLPSSSTTPSSPASTTGTTIQDPPAELETSTSETTIQKPEGPPVEEILGMAGCRKSKVEAQKNAKNSGLQDSFIPKSTTWKPWQRPRFKFGSRGMKFLRLENYHSKGFKSTQFFSGHSSWNMEITRRRQIK